MSIAHFLFIFDAGELIRSGGLALACLVVFGSTGLFFCFFLPSGAILFTAGVFVATGSLHYNIFTVCALLVSASFAGNMTGYWFGRQTGPLLYRREDSKFFRKHHLTTAATFYNKYGWLALTVGMFLPIIRTFASIVAGIVRLQFKRFALLSFTGSVVWVLSFVLAGYLIGGVSVLKPWINYIVFTFILIITIPLLVRLIRELRKLRKENEKRK